MHECFPIAVGCQVFFARKLDTNDALERASRHGERSGMRFTSGVELIEQLTYESRHVSL